MTWLRRHASFIALTVCAAGIFSQLYVVAVADTRMERVTAACVACAASVFFTTIAILESARRAARELPPPEPEIEVMVVPAEVVERGPESVKRYIRARMDEQA